METGESEILNKDLFYKKEFWGKKVESVKIISISGNAVIFERYNGKRFPCSIKDLE